MSRCARRPSLVETAVRIVRIDCAVRPSLPMTLPMSSLATRNSMRLLLSPAISVTTTWSGWSTSSIAMVWIRSLRGIGLLRQSGLELRQTLQEAIHRLRRRRSVLAPVLQPLTLHGEKAGILRRVVGADVLQKATATRAPVIGHDEAVKRALLRARSGKTDMDSHDKKPFGVTACFESIGATVLRQRTERARTVRGARAIVKCGGG